MGTDPPTDPVPNNGPTDSPEQLQSRIDEMRERGQTPPPDSSLARAMVLFLSMGFTFAGALVAAIWLGDYLARRTGHTYWYLIMILIGLASGCTAVFQMLRPLLAANARE